MAITIKVYHALLRIQFNNQGLKFSEGQFNVKWATYVRQLIEYPGLGALCVRRLQELKYVTCSSSVFLSPHIHTLQD